jgi:hypothetical protein
MKKRATPLACLILGVAILAPLVLIFGGFIPVSSRQVQLAVTFKLTDPDYHPLPGVPIRLLVCSDKGWQEPDAGYRFVTDANGEGHVTIPAVLDRRWRTMDSSFIGFPMLTDHIAAGAEMEYMNFHWVYVVDSVLYPEGTSGLDHFSVYTRDGQGRFTRQAVETNDGWIIQDLDGKMITSPGYDPWDFSLAHDDAGQNWTLKLAFKKFPPAVQR